MKAPFDSNQVFSVVLFVNEIVYRDDAVIDSCLLLLEFCSVDIVVLVGEPNKVTYNHS